MNFNVDDEYINNLVNKEYSEKFVENALRKDRINVEDFASLLKFDNRNSNLFENLAHKSKELTDSRFGKVKGLYIPLYLSNYCDNICTYCGFKKDNEIRRTTLSLKDVELELSYIYKKGFRNILLVSGEMDQAKNIGYIAKSVAIAKKLKFHFIAVEIGAKENDALDLLTGSGATSFVLYQESYHRDAYSKVHTSGKKRDFDYRINGMEKSLQHGFTHAALGFLAGLYDPVYEAIALYLHIDYLKKYYPDIEYSISIPRITDAAGVDSSFYSVDDKQFAQILMSFRLAFKDVPIYLSTRENERLRDGMLKICVTHLSVESKTYPGGYNKNNDEALEQFATTDKRDLHTFIKKINELGYDVHFKDWNKELVHQNTLL